MSEAAQNMGDEPPVVGEPASQPHHAAVVGEPPEEMVPVLGEPVSLANGLQNDQQPVATPSPDETAINGILKVTSPAAEPPSQSSDAPSSTDSTVESTNPAMAEEHVASEEASTEGGTHRSATESPIPSGFNTETSDDAYAQEAPDALDSTHNNNEANFNAETSADVDVTHIADVPSQPPPPGREISTENPFAALDEGSPETDLNVSVEGEEPEVLDVPSETDKQAVAAVEEEESTKDVDASAVDSQEVVTKSPAAHEEITKGLGSTEETMPTTESKTEGEEKNVINAVSEVSEPTVSEEAKLAEPQQVDTATEEFVVGGSSPEETEEVALDSAKDPVSTGDEKGQEDGKMEESSIKSGTTSSEVEHVKSREASLPGGISIEEASAKDAEYDASAEASPSDAEQVLSREAVLPEAFSSEKFSDKESGDDQAAPDSSLVHVDKDVSTPMESSGLRAIAVEANMGDQPPSDETSLGENGLQHGEDGIPLEREQGLTKDEKPSSFFKLPVIVSTVAIAVVGVVIVSLSRSRQ